MKTTIDIIKEISLSNESIDFFSLVSFGNPRDIVKDANWSLSELASFENAMFLRKQYGLPFWEALMITQLEDKYSSEKILRSSNYHNNITYVKYVTPSQLEYGLQLLPNLGINSKVILNDNQIMHIPMIDFRVPFSDSRTKIVSVICSELGQKGYIMNSGKSYHFIGNRPVKYEELISFLGRALLYSPLVDTTWIGHQLIDGSATLRLGVKNGHLPELVKMI